MGRQEGIHERSSEVLGDDMSLAVVSVWEDGAEHVVYEVTCDLCGEADQFDQRAAAETYGPQHRCGGVEAVAP